MTTFAEVLQRRLRERPGDPLLTFYDHHSGERTELSVTTYANWVAKAASLLVDELGLERGQRLLLELPTHWLGPVALGAAWTAGLEVVWDGAADAVWCGPDTVADRAEQAREVPVLASALLPLGGRFAHDLPAGVHDVGVEIWGQPDAFVPWDPPEPGDAAVAGLSQAAVWAAAVEGRLLTPGGRLLTSANPASATGLACFTQPLALGGSLVLTVHSSAEQLAASYDAERATALADQAGQPTKS